jgi:hypothetical protein
MAIRDTREVEEQALGSAAALSAEGDAEGKCPDPGPESR